MINCFMYNILSNDCRIVPSLSEHTDTNYEDSELQICVFPLYVCGGTNTLTQASVPLCVGG